MQFRGHWCFGISSCPSLGSLECLCSSVLREIADGFQMKWMLQQMCQCERNDVWERTRDCAYERAAPWQGFFFVARQKMNWGEMRILTELFKLMLMGNNPFLPAFSWATSSLYECHCLCCYIIWFRGLIFYGIIIHRKSSFSGKSLPSPVYWCIYELSGVTSDSLLRFHVPLPHISQYE